MIAAPADRVPPPLDMEGNQLAFFENCVERATALAATCGWLAFGGGAEAAVGVAIGGAGLAAVVSDAVRRHGPESEAALKSIRKRIAADLAAHAEVERWDTRADLDAADASMERALAGCFLDRKALAASARSPEGFPGSATKLILARLAEREPATFGQDGPRAARDFADLVVRTALEAAIENEGYFKNLQPHLLMEALRGLGAVEEKIDTGFRKVHETTGETHELVREIHGRIVRDTKQGAPDVRSISDLAHPSMTAHSGRVLSMVFFKSGEKLATLGADNNISVWDANEGNQLASVAVGGPATSGCLAAFASSDEFCSSDHDAGTHFWNGDCDPVYVNGFKALGPPSNKRMVYSPDGTRIAAATYSGGLKILDSASREAAGSLMAHLPEGGGRYAGYESDHTKAVCYSPDGELIATGSGIGQIRIWRTSDVEGQNDRTRAKCLMEFWAQKESIHDLCFSEDGSHLFSSSDDKTIAIWSIQSERQIGRLVGHTLWISSMILCGDYLVSAGPKSYNKPERRFIGGDLFVWNWKTKRAIIRLEEESYVSSLASSPKGDRFAAGGSDGLLRIWSFKDLFELISAAN